MKKTKKKEAGECLVWQSNELLKARSNLTSNELKFILKCISTIKRTDKEFKDNFIEISEFCELLNIKYTRSLVRELQKISINILKKPFPISDPKGIVYQYNWFARVSYVKEKKHVAFCHHPDLIPFLINIKKYFTAYKLKYILPLSGIYSIIFFEFLHKNKQQKSTITIDLSLEETRKAFGVEDGKYKLFGHFKSKVIDFAKKELKLHTDLMFTYKEKKIGNKVVGMTVTASDNLKNITPEKKDTTSKNNADNNASEEISNNKDDQSKTDYQKIIALILPPNNKYKTLPKVINLYLKKMGFDYVKAAVVHSTKNSNDAFMGYLKQTLKGNYAKFGIAKPDPKIADAKKEAKECFKNPGNCSNGVWSSYAETNACFHCERHKDARNLASKPRETVEAKPAPIVNPTPEPQKVAAQTSPVETQPQELSEMELMKQQQQIQQQQMRQMMEQMQEMQQTQMQEKQALQQKIQQLEAGKSAPGPVEAAEMEDVRVGPDDFNDRQPSPSTLADSKLIAKWWIIREAVKEKIGSGPHDINLYPLILDYSRSDENKLTLLAPHGFSRNSLIKKGYLAMIQEAAGNIEIMLEVAPPKKSGFYNQPEHATA